MSGKRSTELSLVGVLDWVRDHATATDLAILADVMNARRRALRDVAAAQVTAGAEVQLQGLTPSALVGLTGTLQAIGPRHCAVLLDVESTARLARWGTKLGGSAMLSHVSGQRYLLGGVPRSACVPA